MAYYSFCGCNANDNSGNGNHGTIVGNPSCTKGIKGEGLLFNQTPGDNGCGQAGGEYVKLPTFGPIWEEGFTVCSWIKFENLSNYERIIDLGNGEGDNGGTPIWFGRVESTDNLTFESWINSDGVLNRDQGRLVADNSITNGSIEMYCATIDMDSMKIYVNGKLAEAKKGNPILNIERTNNFLGRSNWCSSDPDFKGFMDEVRIYNRPLSSAEINTLYNSPFFAESADTILCPGQSLELQAKGGVKYEWSPSTFLSSDTSSHPIVTPDNSMTYTVKIYFPDGCFITDTVDVVVGKCDCKQIVNGQNIIDSCGICLLPEDSLFNATCADCFGVPNGTAIMDSCGICLLANDPLFNTSCLDCKGIINGKSIIDSCGDCKLKTDPAFNANCTDCNGTIFGKAILDTCGKCLEVTDPNFNKSCHITIIDVYFPNILSLSSKDGNNNFTALTPLNNAKIEECLVFDRWGNVVFKIEDIQPESLSEAWANKFEGKNLVPGVYAYFVKVSVDEDHKIFTGDLTILP